MNVSWSHCVLNVRDLDAMASFYCDTLGFRVADRGPLGADNEIVFLSGCSSDHHQLALASGRGPEPGGGLNHNAFRVETISEVIELVDQLAADERVQNGHPITHGNAVSVYFSDPEGNGIEVFCDTPWHVKQPQAKRWDPSMSEEEVLAAIETEFRDEPEFMPMASYRTKQAELFGET